MDSNEHRELERLFGGNPRIKATLEQACGFCNKDTKPAETQSVFGDRESLLGHVVQRAKELGTWIERIENYVKESDVFISKRRPLCYQTQQHTHNIYRK